MHAHFPITIRNQWLKEPTNVCPVVGNWSGSPQWCRARWRWQCALGKGFVDSTDVVSFAASPLCTIEVTNNDVNLLTNHDGTDCEDELLGNTPFFDVDVAYM